MRQKHVAISSTGLSMKDAAFLTAGLGPFFCLILFVPLWAPEVLLGKPPAPSRRFSFSDLSFGDGVGIVPLGFVTALVAYVQPSWVAPHWYVGSLVAAFSLASLLCIRSIQFALAHNVVTSPQRARLGLTYPALYGHGAMHHDTIPTTLF